MDFSKFGIIECFVKDVKTLWNKYAFHFPVTPQMHAILQVYTSGSTMGKGVVGSNVSLWVRVHGRGVS